MPLLAQREQKQKTEEALEKAPGALEEKVEEAE
jgi:hypothetical protein